MNNEKNVLVPYSMLLTAYKLVFRLASYELDKDTAELLNTLTTHLNAKFDQMAKRESFTAYKTAPRGTEEREKARQEYINSHAEISKDFQTKKEIEI